MGFRFRFDPGAEFRKVVFAWARALKDLRWLWPEVADAVEAHHIDIFNREGGGGGPAFKGWMPLSKATVKARFFGWDIPDSYTGAYGSSSTEGPEGRVLHWTHTLRRSVTQRRAEGAIRRFGKGFMDFGTSLPYAEVHQFGGEEPLGEDGQMRFVPARPFLDATGSIPHVAKALFHGVFRMLENDGKTGGGPIRL